MLSHPLIGQPVVIHYAKKMRPIPHHGLRGTVIVAGKRLQSEPPDRNRSWPARRFAGRKPEQEGARR